MGGEGDLKRMREEKKPFQRRRRPLQAMPDTIVTKDSTGDPIFFFAEKLDSLTTSTSRLVVDATASVRLNIELVPLSS